MIQKDYCQGIFDEVAESSYCLLEHHTRYQHYLEYLNILAVNMPTEETSPQAQDTPSLDTTLYVDIIILQCI